MVKVKKVNQTTTISGLGLSLLAATLASGCYTGVDVPTGADGADDAPVADGNQVGGDDDGIPPREPEPGADESEEPFSVPSDEARLLPFPVRMQNLADLIGQPADHPMFLDLLDLRFQLGDHDFASGVAPDLRWSAEKMQNWVRGLRPVCSSAEMQVAYPGLLTDPRPFMRQAWGHEPAAEEVESMADLQDSTLPVEQQYLLTCLAVLTSLDFVSI